MNVAGTLSDWAVAVAAASAIPANVILVENTTIAFPDFRGVDDAGRATLAVPPNYDQPDQFQTVHEAGHALQAVAPLDALATYWSIRGLPGDPSAAYRQARAIDALGVRSTWGHRPHERFAETFAVVLHPIPATERMLPTDWVVPPLDEERRKKLRVFFAGLPRRPQPWYVPIGMYDQLEPPLPIPTPPASHAPSDDLGVRITAFWQRDDIPDWFRVWARNFEDQYGKKLRALA